MKTNHRAAVWLAILLVIAGCAHLPKLPPECRGDSTPINSPDVKSEARP
jgi:hypothetical protein